MAYRYHYKNHTSFILAGLALISSAAAEVKTFTVGKASPAQQIAQVESVTDLETFTGRTDKVTGSITFDPAKRTGKGSLVVNLASLETGIGLRDEHMRDKGWLYTEKFPEAKFESITVKHAKGDTYRVTGRFTLRGVTKNLTTIATVKHLKGSATTRKARFSGDVLLIRSELSIKLADFGIVIPEPAKGKVASTVTIRISTYAQSGA